MASATVSTTPPPPPPPPAANDGKSSKPLTAAPRIIISGGGMGGLVLALALHRQCSLTPVVYEQAGQFTDGAGGAIGMYPNGLRVIRDVSPSLLSRIREAGYPYVYRRWMRHDGRTVAVGREKELTDSKSDDDELAPIGIRRWKLQKALYDACVEAGVPVRFGKRVVKVTTSTDDGAEGEGGGEVECTFADGSTASCDVLFGADGVKSKVREAIVGPSSSETDPLYTGVTCLMGASDVPRPVRGICFPSSVTTKCHECTYPTGPDEQVFQIYFPTPVENAESWGTLSPEEGKRECAELADRMERDGWDEQFLKPLRAPIEGSVVRVGLRARDPLERWVSKEGTVALLGDAAHPPVPYIGQGAMMAIEDAGVLASLLKHFCCRPPADDAKTAEDDDGKDGGYFERKNVPEALRLYELMRIPRTRQILGSSKELGKTQQMRADSWWYNLAREHWIKIQVLMHGTLPIMKPGAMYDYRKEVERILVESEEGA